MPVISILHDERVDCFSIMTEMEIADFLRLVTDVYEERGGIEGQRAPLKTKTGISIRSRLVSDLVEGAVIPPIVIGVQATKVLIDAITKPARDDTLLEHIVAVDAASLSIIDGMQRTTALLEAVGQKPALGKDRLRVEFWVSQNLNSLIYRMLVLNTGQVPWEISRQLETIYSQLLSIITSDLGTDVEIFTLNEERRRSEGGQYQASSIIRLFLAFSSRKPEFDLKDKVAEDFARMDAIEASSHREFLGYFIRTLKLAAQLDRLFSRSSGAPAGSKERIADGKELFQSFPALTGFFVAVAVKIFDEPGFDIDWELAAEKLQSVEAAVTALIDSQARSTQAQIDEFLQLETLNLRLAQRSGQIGRFERDLFVRSFTFMIDKAARLKDMAPAWRA